MNYYNENDAFCAQWLCNLMEEKLIPNGWVDTRDIREVTAHDLSGFRQAHFFAGIGGWPRALALAGWPEDSRVWTGSCPCQPFSIAGKQLGFKDERDLWPAWLRLIEEHAPSAIFGEQVASAKLWLDRAFDSLEAMGYACGAALMPACAVNAPHIRRRLFFCSMGYPFSSGLPLREFGAESAPEKQGIEARAAARQPSGASDFWHDASWSRSSDGKSRRIKPSIRLLDDGIPNRVAKLRALGNAIVPQAAAEFIRAAA